MSERMHTRRRRAAERGSTLVEILIVVAIMATLAGMVTLVAFPELKKARIRTAAVGAGQVRAAAEIYREVDQRQDVSACPTVDELVLAKKLRGKQSDDPWGTRYAVSCEDDELHGLSAGNDRKAGTPDDVRDDLKAPDVERIAGM
jgi:general secretion pathway protein G